MSVYRSVLSVIFALFSLLFMGAVAANGQSAATAEPNAKLAFENWLNSLNDQRVSITTDEIAFDQDSGRLTVNGIAFTFRAGEAASAADSVTTVLTFDKLDLQGFATSTDGVSFDNALIEGFQLKASTASSPAMSVRSLVLRHVFLPSIKNFIAYPQKPISSQVALLRLLSAAMADEVIFSGLSVGEGFTAEVVEFSAIARGAAEQLKMKVVSSSPSAAGAEAAVGRKVSANSVVVTKIDFDPYLRLFEASAYLEAGAARPWKNLIEKIDIVGLIVEGQGRRLVTDTIALTGLKARQFPEDITDLFDKTVVDPGFLVADQDAAATFTAAIRGAFAIDAISVGATSVSTSNAEGEVTVAVASGLVSGLAADRIDAINIMKPSYSDPLRSLQTESLRLENINLPTQIAGQPVSAAPASLPQVGSVKISGFHGKIDEAQFGFGQLNIDMAYFLGGTPTNVKLSLDNLKLPTVQIAVPGIRDTLAAFGYQDIDVSLALSGSWQERTSEIAIENAALAIAGLGKLSGSGSLTGVTRAGVEDPAVKLPQELSGGGLKNFRLLVENQTFFQSLVKEIAKQNNRQEDEISKALASNMPAIMQNVSPTSVKNKLIFAGVAFVNDPQSLEFVSRTTDVVPWSEILPAFAIPALLPGLLQLDVRANGRQ